jgi:asparagine synthase (glutamine-hydrolysing)
MCGINGFNWNDEKLIKDMNESIKHRGPDDRGVYTSAAVSIGQVRLSIIDLSPAGHNPMFYDKQHGAFSERHQKQLLGSELAEHDLENLAIVFNGEIYNFQDIKEELLEQGYIFSSKSDTEVILASYLEWGPECVKKFNGMWAFCIYDRKKNILFLSRDRLGVKPLYYYLENKKFVFSSELKGILVHKELRINIRKNINPEAVELYFSSGFIPSPMTIYKNVFKLEPRQNMIFDLGKGVIRKKWEYYHMPYAAPFNDKKSLVREGRKILRDAVRLRMIADVPIGAFLSGGLDSSTVVGVMKDFTELKKLHTFSIGFEGRKYDETKYMTIVKDYYKTKHHHKYFVEKDFKKIMSLYPKIYDEPFGDYSGFPTYDVSRLARQYVTICLSGDGGDEIFAGYNIHLTAARMHHLRKVPKFLRRLGSMLPAKKNINGFASTYLLKEAFKISLDKPERFFSSVLPDDSLKTKAYDRWTEKKLRYCLDRCNQDFGEAMRMYNTLADNFLVKVDRASMYNALEVRSPFLDYRFIEYSQRIPAKWKADLFNTKILFREIIRGLVPDKIIHRGKQGFTPPLEEWITHPSYAKNLQHGLNILKSLDKNIYGFYHNKVFKENNRLYTNYKIRLFLFSLWWDAWMRSG